MASQPAALPLSVTTLRFLAKATDVGYGQRIDGGHVLEWVDKAGYACAAQWSGRYCVTAFIGDIRFTRPIAVGELVEVSARVAHTGRTSMHIVVTVSSGDPRAGELTRTAQCLAVFIAVDDAGTPVGVPAFTPQTESDRRLQLAAQHRASMRADIDDALAAQEYSDDSSAPCAVLRFLAAPTDVNWGGKVHGGKVMRWIDEAAFLCAAQWTGGDVIASRINGIRFYRPIVIGNMIEVRARLIHSSARRLYISVHVQSSDVRTGAGDVAAHAMALFAELDQGGRAMTVRQWSPVTEEDRRLDQHAVELVEVLRHTATK
ncbi:acyl-CoA thioesterase [[Mycobacterium] nativiensis]|uniref:Hotdog domain-containing protein n=1 Tax=[Mycobacterium] nativiensis TaxID=2855503 RepID=A0ABU5XX93_9MYCO|nr:hotdog domain-containing protein [Mycolicibacter sp. MYC340]MEB3032408.1 hotdog domain-containing protein [Mycolicibacter sp. MYC340]